MIFFRFPERLCFNFSMAVLNLIILPKFAELSPYLGQFKLKSLPKPEFSDIYK